MKNTTNVYNKFIKLKCLKKSNFKIKRSKLEINQLVDIS